MKNTIYIYIVAFISALFFTVEIEAKDKFVVVIDAGHGGNDPGAVANRLQEKNINLDIALKLGKMIQRNCSDTKVIYTRSKDVFVTLKGRTEIGNKAKADLLFPYIPILQKVLLQKVRKPIYTVWNRPA